MLNAIHLRTLVAVVGTGSFAGAAKRLGYTPSAVSQQMMALERSAGVALFDRRARSIRPTSAAVLIVDRSHELLALLDALEDDVRSLAGGTLGRLRVGSFATASQHLVPSTLGRLARRAAELDVVLDEGEPDLLVPMVLDRQLDIALAYDYGWAPRAWPRGLVRTPLLSEDVVAVLPASHAADRVALEDLAREVWIATVEGTAGATMLDRACASAGFVPRIDYRTNDYEVVHRLVASGLGVALVPALGHRSVPGVRTVPVAGMRGQRSVVAVHRRASTAPAVPVVLEALQESARALVATAARGGIQRLALPSEHQHP